MYTAPLSSINGVKFQFYADNTQLCNNLCHNNPADAFDKLNRCLQDVKEWTSTSKLKLNPDKTEFIIFGSKGQRGELSPHLSIEILGNSLQPAESVQYLGVWFDSDFSPSKHIENICKGCFLQLRDFRQIRSYLPSDQ